MVSVALILKHFLVWITGQLVLGKMFHSHLVEMKEKCCCGGFPLGFGRKRWVVLTIHFEVGASSNFSSRYSLHQRLLSSQSCFINQ